MSAIMTGITTGTAAITNRAIRKSKTTRKSRIRRSSDLSPLAG